MSTERSDIAHRWAAVNAGFATIVDAVHPDDWDRPSPCEGWTARDVVEHLVEWVPAFLAADGADMPAPIGANAIDSWRDVSDRIQQILDDPAASSANFEHPQAGAHALDDAVSTFICSDVLVHTWDLAAATGQEIDLDPEAVDHYLAAFEQVDEQMLVSSGQFAPRHAIADNASRHDRLLALTGRDPSWPTIDTQATPADAGTRRDDER